MAGSKQEYEAFLLKTKTNPSAAEFLERASQLVDVSPNDREIVYVGSYRSSDVFMSKEHERYCWAKRSAA